MKASTIISISGLFASSALAQGWGQWICNADGNVSGYLLPTAAWFDTLWGADALTLAGAQSYVTQCSGYTFGLVNYASVAYTEDVSERSEAVLQGVDADGCIWYLNDGYSQYYVFGSNDRFAWEYDNVLFRNC